MNAQIAHFFAGCTVILAAVALLGWSVWWGFLIVLVWASLKEFIFDILVEQDGWENGWIDWAFYLLGAAVALTLASWKGYE